MTLLHLLVSLGSGAMAAPTPKSIVPRQADCLPGCGADATTYNDAVNTNCDEQVYKYLFIVSMCAVVVLAVCQATHYYYYHRGDFTAWKEAMAAKWLPGKRR